MWTETIFYSKVIENLLLFSARITNSDYSFTHIPYPRLDSRRRYFDSLNKLVRYISLYRSIDK